MGKEKEKVEWDLTEVEIAELKRLHGERRGFVLLVRSMNEAMNETMLCLDAWWNSTRRIHSIPDKYSGELEADYQVGKIWVRNKKEYKSVESIF